MRLIEPRERSEFILRVREREQQAAEKICRGGAKDFGEYKDLCGYLRAIEDILQDIEDVRKNINHEGKQDGDSTYEGD